MPRRMAPMRRSELSRGGKALARRTPLRSKRSGRARPGEPLATWCQARIAGVCTGRASHRHHIVLRSQGGSDDRANTLDVCSACHGRIHARPGEAYAAGLLARREAS